MTTQDKLAEALLARIQKAWEAHSEDGKVSISMRDAMELCEQVLPTVIQQAQPPAASVTDSMVERGLKACIQDSDARLPRYKVVRSIIEAALAAQDKQ